MTGAVMIARTLWDDAAFQNEPFSEREAWIWMICEAAWKSRQKRVGKVIVDLDRGQLAASIRFMAEAFSWHRNKVDRLIKRLEKCNLIRAESGTGVNVITICKYNDYQLSPKSFGTSAGQQRDSSGTNENKGEISEEGKERDTNVSLALSAPEPASPLAEAVSLYNATADETGWPKVQKLTPARSKALKARLRDCGGIEGWRFAMDKGKSSDFLCGRTPKAWTGCGFDWITKQANFAKLMEGNYDNRDSNANGSRSGGSGNAMVDAFAAVAAERTAQNGGN